MFDVKENQHVCVLWSAPLSAPDLTNIVDELKKVIGDAGKVSVENTDMLISSKYPNSTFDVILSGICSPFSTDHTSDILGEILRISKPGGRIVLRELKKESSNELSSSLKLAGFTSVGEARTADLSDDEKTQVKENKVVEICAHKPNFEVGSSMKLSFAVAKPAVSNSNNVWKLGDLGDEDVDLEDPDDLLTEDDLKLPDPSSLKVCGTTGKRKACKSCVCGLKEELEHEEDEKRTVAQKEFKSSCGSCYLGDAFRCASCPYLGMPAFKPGEKVKLVESTLQDKL